MTKLSNAIVDKALEEGKNIDRQARIEALQKQLARVQKDIAEQERLERRWTLVQSAFAKLKQELGKTLSPEEYQAIDGIYLFLHSGCVDMVRHVPSATSKGEDTRLERDLDMAEALKELASLTEKAK
jgi:vacuolar-type H+-ATPase subunit E/Vma4